MAYHQRYGLETRIARIFNTYGTRMRPDDGRLVPALISKALSGDQILIYGDGSQGISVQYVSDLIEGIRRLMRTRDVRPVNLGDPAEYTVLEIIELILSLSKSQSPQVYMPLPEGNRVVRSPDISRARQVLGWRPQVMPREGLGETILWCTENRNFDTHSNRKQLAG